MLWPEFREPEVAAGHPIATTSRVRHHCELPLSFPLHPILTISPCPTGRSAERSAGTRTWLADSRRSSRSRRMRNERRPKRGDRAARTRKRLLKRRCCLSAPCVRYDLLLLNARRELTAKCPIVRCRRRCRIQKHTSSTSKTSIRKRPFPQNWSKCRPELGHPSLESVSAGM